MPITNFDFLLQEKEALQGQERRSASSFALVLTRLWTLKPAWRQESKRSAHSGLRSSWAKISASRESSIRGI